MVTFMAMTVTVMVVMVTVMVTKIAVMVLMVTVMVMMVVMSPLTPPEHAPHKEQFKFESCTKSYFIFNRFRFRGLGTNWGREGGPGTLPSGPPIPCASRAPEAPLDNRMKLLLQF
jgi:hypothetical protein